MHWAGATLGEECPGQEDLRSVGGERRRPGQWGPDTEGVCRVLAGRGPISAHGALRALVGGGCGWVGGLGFPAGEHCDPADRTTWSNPRAQSLTSQSHCGPQPAPSVHTGVRAQGVHV